jgi:hypothetical protein
MAIETQDKMIALVIVIQVIATLALEIAVRVISEMTPAALVMPVAPNLMAAVIALVVAVPVQAENILAVVALEVDANQRTITNFI